MNYFFYDSKNTEIKFEYYRESKFPNNVSYAKENISLSNKKFIDIGYDSLETILNNTSLNCHCTHEHKQLNIIGVIIILTSGFLKEKMIVSITYKKEDPDDPIIIPKIFKAYKWR